MCAAPLRPPPPTFDYLVKLLVLGDAGVGKTTFLRQDLSPALEATAQLLPISDEAGSSRGTNEPLGQHGSRSDQTTSRGTGAKGGKIVAPCDAIVISQLLWSLGKLDQRPLDRRWARSLLIPALAARLPEMNSQGISNSLWGEGGGCWGKGDVCNGGNGKTKMNSQGSSNSRWGKYGVGGGQEQRRCYRVI